MISVLVVGRSSLEKTLIAIGLAIQTLCTLLFLGVPILGRMDLGANRFQTMFLVNSAIRVVSLAGVTLLLIGVVKLLRRTAEWELLQEDESDDDR